MGNVNYTTDNLICMLDLPYTIGIVFQYFTMFAYALTNLQACRPVTTSSEKTRALRSRSCSEAHRNAQVYQIVYHTVTWSIDVYHGLSSCLNVHLFCICFLLGASQGTISRTPTIGILPEHQWASKRKFEATSTSAETVLSV